MGPEPITNITRAQRSHAFTVLEPNHKPHSLAHEKNFPSMASTSSAPYGKYGVSVSPERSVTDVSEGQ